MQTEMLIGSTLRQGHRARGEDPQPAHRRDDPRRCPKPRPSRSTTRSPPPTTPSPTGRAPRPASAPATSSSSPTASRPRPTTSPTLEALNCGKPQARGAPRRDPGGRRLLPLLRRRLPRHARLGGGRISARLHLDDPPRSDRRRRLDRALELPADDGGVEARARARRRQHRRAEAVRADAADHAEARQDRRRDPSRGRPQHRRRPRRDRRQRPDQPSRRWR